MAKKTSGRLYTSGAKGYYYLRYKFEGKETRTRLLAPDGKPITAQREAKAAADRILARIHETNKAEQLRTLKNDIQDAEAAAEVADRELKNSKATISQGWKLFMTCPSRLKSCKRTTAGGLADKSTAASYQAYYRRFAEWLSKNAPEVRLLSDVTPEHADAFAVDLQNTVAPGTYNKHRFFLTALFDTLASDEKIIIARNPFATIPRADGAANSRRAMTITELQRIIERADQPLKLLLQVGTFTGLRLGDCCTLQWGEIDLHRQIIRRKPRKTASRTQKTVTLGISNLLRQALNIVPLEDQKGFLFPEYAEIYLQPNGTNKMTKMIQRHFRACGIELYAPGTGMKYHYEGKNKVYEKTARAVVQVGFHSLRHTWVSLHAMHGTPQAVIQDAAGHANPAMTEHYTHISPEAARLAAAAVDLPALASPSDVIETTATEAEPERAELHRLADTLSMEQIYEILNSYRGKK